MPEQATSEFNIAEVSNQTPQKFQHDPFEEYLNPSYAFEDIDLEVKEEQ